MFIEYVKDFIVFVLKEAKAALFAGLFLALLFLSVYVHIPGLTRYDFLFVAAVLIQVLMIAFKLETEDEAKTIFLFHIIGLVLEIYKTNPHIGSWSYPEAGYLKVFNVPLYSGFMYASIGSYIAAAWNGVRLELVDHPKYVYSITLCFLIYLNFFTDHFIYDFRIWLILAIFALYYKTKIRFTPRTRTYSMPLTLGLLCTAFFVWIAENIGTFYGAWLYPYQLRVWQVVSFYKITSWFLMVIICFIIVSYLKHTKEETKKPSVE